MPDSVLSTPLLTADDPAPATVLNPDGAAPLLLVCDHASFAVPASLAGLGLTEDQLIDHIGWDSGAAAVTQQLSESFDAPAVLSGYSRLVIDCNRPPGHPTSIPAESDGIPVPGNRDLSGPEIEQRVADIFEPYHDAVRARLDAFRARDVLPAVIAMHSFTPVMAGVARPWEVSILWNQDARIPVPLIEALRAEGLTVGDNEPYSGREHYGYTMDVHATALGLPHALIELRADTVADTSGISAMSDLMGRVLRPILADDALYRAVWH